MGSSTKRMRLALARPEMFAAAAPICPKCNKPMTPRMAKRGPGVEHRFWGCVAFPACLGTRVRR
jgi:ssDNA-binding Zn-finger/Zn-ribbon topoisomerase 1